MATLSVPPTEQRDQPPRLLDLGSVFFWGAGLLLLVGLLAYLVIAWGGEDHFTDADATRVLERTKILQDRNTEDYKYLHDQPSWFKKDAGLVRVPIAEAMAMTLPALQANKPHPAYPIAQSPPQNASAPTSPDKGPAPGAKGGDGKTNDINPAASNPTVGQPSPAPVVAQTPAPATAASNAPPAAPAAPMPSATPPPAPVTSPKVESTPVPTPTPYTSAGPSANNNANNPGTPPIPGKDAQPAAPAAATNTSGPVANTTPAPSGAQPAPLPHPPAQPTEEPAASPASSAATPTPNPREPGASPAGTP